MSDQSAISVSPSITRPPRSALHLWPWLAAASSGLLLALCFAPWNLGPLCWIALTPLICAVWFSRPTKRNGLRKALLGYVTGIVFFTATFYWLSTLGILFGEFWLRGLSLLLALYMGLYLAFWAWFISRLHDGVSRFTHSSGNIATALLGASAWVAHEWVRGWLFSGFGWNGLGVALHKDLAMIQIVDITGVWGLSFLITFCNLMGVIIVRRLLAEIGPIFLKRIRWEFSFTMALVAAVFAYGVRTLMQGNAAEPTTTVRIGMIQPNTKQTEKWSADSENRIFERLDLLTTAVALSKPDLIVWPEASTPRGMFADETNYSFIMKQVEHGDFSLLIGTVDTDIDRREDYNVATLLNTHGTQLQTHKKMHLVPFGEYLPLRTAFPLFAMVAGELVPSDFTPGRQFTVLTLPKPAIKFSALICFEDTLGDLTRQFVLNGAQLLVNITNDGWFLETAGAEQHLHNALFRAVENRRPLLRCANTGVTCSIDRFGRVDRWYEPFREEVQPAREIRVPISTAHTFYGRHGDWLAIGASLVTGLNIAGAALRRRYAA
ncbi:MAG: Apolipoprotein N-acyltransferase [Chthoniobacteraceae bacterium]|nr:Apolipoprotein N-acyltransferase [Chthoniobacteraceae bacterium]